MRAREKRPRCSNQKYNNDRQALPRSEWTHARIGAALFQDCFVGRPNGFVGWRGFFSPERSEVGRTGTLASLCSGALNLAAQRCSNLLWAAKGITLITTSSVFLRAQSRTVSEAVRPGEGHKCVANKGKADFPPVLKFDHTISSALSCFAMPEPIDKLLLARAFDLAWEQFYGSDNSAPLPEDIARPALAKFLVEMAKSGVREENALAGRGRLALGRPYNGATRQIRPLVA